MKQWGYQALGYGVWQGRKLRRFRAPFRRRPAVVGRDKVVAAAIVALIIVAGAIVNEPAESS